MESFSKINESSFIGDTQNSQIYMDAVNTEIKIQYRINKFSQYRPGRNRHRDYSLTNSLLSNNAQNIDNHKKSLFSLYQNSFRNISGDEAVSSYGRFMSPENRNETQAKLEMQEIEKDKYIKLSGYGTLKKLFKKHHQMMIRPSIKSANEEKKEDENKINSETERRGANDKVNRKFFGRSQAGKTEDGMTKSNQDSYFTLNNIFKLEKYHIYGVLDGHGIHGHYISNHVKNFLVSFYTDIENYLYTEKINKKSEENNQSSQNNINPNGGNNSRKKPSKIFFKEDFIYEKLKKNNHEFIKLSLYLAEMDLKNTTHEVNYSGTTCNLVILIEDKILCANIGDSRAILIEEASVSGFYKTKPLSVDHKPEKDEEKERIEKWGGEVKKAEFGPFRVWKKGERFPGIAMSRSIGDFVASSIGVICKPDIFEIDRTEKTKAVIVCSDGVWEFLNNEKVMQLTIPYFKSSNPEGACKNIIKESNKCWKKEEIIRDDITVIVVFL